jgi:hypothetical protein
MYKQEEAIARTLATSSKLYEENNLISLVYTKTLYLIH